MANGDPQTRVRVTGDRYLTSTTHSVADAASAGDTAGVVFSKTCLNSVIETWIVVKSS